MDSNRLLYDAVFTSKVEDVKKLLDSGVDPNIENNEGKHLFIWQHILKTIK